VVTAVQPHMLKGKRIHLAHESTWRRIASFPFPLSSGIHSCTVGVLATRECSQTENVHDAAQFLDLALADVRLSSPELAAIGPSMITSGHACCSNGWY
jgi:hypothetical protein